MSDQRFQNTGNARDIDLGELGRPNTEHLPPGPLKSSDKRVLFGFLAVAAALAAAVVSMVR